MDFTIAYDKVFEKMAGSFIGVKIMGELIPLLIELISRRI